MTSFPLLQSLTLFIYSVNDCCSIFNSNSQSVFLNMSSMTLLHWFFFPFDIVEEEQLEVEIEMKFRSKRTWEASEAKESWSWTSDAKEQRSTLPEAEEKIVKITESGLTSRFRKPGLCRFWSSNPSSGIVVSSCHEREREMNPLIWRVLEGNWLSLSLAEPERA